MERNSGSGAEWVMFAGVMVMLAGVLNFIWGIAALESSHFFASNATFIVSDLHTWGWIAIVLGVLEAFAAASIFGGGEFGRWFGIMAASFNAISALLSIQAYPAWGLCLFAVDVLVIYGLAAYGGEPVVA
jgi:hypothetical protein